MPIGDDTPAEKAPGPEAVDHRHHHCDTWNWLRYSRSTWTVGPRMGPDLRKWFLLSHECRSLFFRPLAAWLRPRCGPSVPEGGRARFGDHPELGRPSLGSRLRLAWLPK